MDDGEHFGQGGFAAFQRGAGNRDGHCGCGAVGGLGFDNDARARFLLQPKNGAAPGTDQDPEQFHAMALHVNGRGVKQLLYGAFHLLAEGQGGTGDGDGAR